MASSKLVWTSDPEEAKRLRDFGALEAAKDVEPTKQTIRVVLDRKRRAGKVVTVASGFQQTAEPGGCRAAPRKKKWGGGGTGRDGEIEIQGDHAGRVVAELQ